MKKDEHISAFAFETGKRIEQLINERMNFLQEENALLEAKILQWYADSQDENFAKYFGIEIQQEGVVSHPSTWDITKIVNEKTLDLGKSLFNPYIWPTPIEKPFFYMLGIENTLILHRQIPFNHTVLNEGDIIENDQGERLLFTQDGYLLRATEGRVFLSNWFSKWRTV